MRVRLAVPRPLTDAGYDIYKNTNQKRTRRPLNDEDQNSCRYFLRKKSIGTRFALSAKFIALSFREIMIETTAYAYACTSIPYISNEMKCYSGSINLKYPLLPASRNEHPMEIMRS